MIQRLVIIFLVLYIIGYPYTLFPQEKRPLSLADIEELFKSGVSNRRIVELISKHGISFAATEEKLNILRDAGVNESIIEVVMKASMENKRPVESAESTMKNGEEKLPRRDQSPIIEKFETHKGYIYVDTDPPSADIYIDGEYVATTPAEIMLVTGDYTVVLIRENYRPYSILLSVKKGINLPLNVRLNPQ